jgi:predicted LPLAT superfamily acyltransferase
MRRMRPDIAIASSAARPEWLTRRERGSLMLLRAMAVVSRAFGRTPTRVILYLIAAYFVIFAPTAKRDARNYLRRALGREPRFADRFRQVLYFATSIHDRIYLLCDRFDEFAFTIEGDAEMRKVVARGQGAFLLGAHMGSFEVSRAIGINQPGLKVVMAMYADNASKVNAMLASLRPTVKPEIIFLGQIQAMLEVQRRLDEGAFVGILADRTLGEEPVRELNFLGSRAYFPIGPMRAAALLRRPTILMLGLYRGGNRYHLVFESLADFSSVSREQRAHAIEEAIKRYAALLEKYCRSDPYNWSNWFDFWDDRSAQRPRRS